jgi:hypothetical protein
MVGSVSEGIVEKIGVVERTPSMQARRPAVK